MFDWFDASEALAFGKELAVDLIKVFPPMPLAEKPTNTKKMQKDAKKLDALARRLQDFTQKHPLNIYKKAKLLNVLKWDLNEAGYDKQFVDETVAFVARVLK